MIYIMSDIHGLYDRYLDMLEKISFSDDDRLYILGDVIDRGDRSFDLLFDIMKRDNVELFLGNHEHMMLTYIEDLDRISWFYRENGGQNTYDQFMELSADKQKEILDYLYNTVIVRNLEISGHKYILSHTSAPVDGRDMFTKDHADDLMEVQGLVWNQYPYDIDSLNNADKTEEEITLISGHIITRRLHDSDDIYVHHFDSGYTWMDIDCGCALGYCFGRLSCLEINDEGVISSIYYVN